MFLLVFLKIVRTPPCTKAQAPYIIYQLAHIIIFKRGKPRSCRSHDRIYSRAFPRIRTDENGFRFLLEERGREWTERGFKLEYSIFRVSNAFLRTMQVKFDFSETCWVRFDQISRVGTSGPIFDVTLIWSFRCYQRLMQNANQTVKLKFNLLVIMYLIMD